MNNDNSYIDLMANDVWLSIDIDNRAREELNGQVSVARQDELRTIMLGHIAGMRVASAKELGEIDLVKTLAETTGAKIVQSRLDMALLADVLKYESAKKRLAQPILELDEAPEYAVIANQEQRQAAQAVVDAATPEALALYTQRNPLVNPEAQ